VPNEAEAGELARVGFGMHGGHDFDSPAV
jgi:hypothetical protein